MAKALLLPGNRFRLYRETTTAGTYEYIGLGTTVSFSRANTFEDATAPDLTDPLVTPGRESALRSTMWDLSFSGRVDPQAFTKIETDANDTAPHRYRIMIDRPGSGGGRTYSGLAWYEKLDMQSQDNGFVTFSATMRGDGPLTTTAAS